jgi:hypothetical protein
MTEEELRIEQMSADIENKRVDTEYKRGLMQFEPWKIVITAVAAGGILGGAIVGAFSYVGRQPPAPIIIQLPPPRT